MNDYQLIKTVISNATPNMWKTMHTNAPFSPVHLSKW